MKCICGLCMAFENFLGLFLFFLKSLIPKKSSGMQKPYVWAVITPTKNQHKNFILVHCGYKATVYGTGGQTNFSTDQSIQVL